MPDGTLGRYVLLATAMLTSACGIGTPAASSAPVQTHALHGVVLSIDAKSKTATVKHGKVEGFMGAMTMEYPVRNAANLAELKPGETIDATVFVQDTDFWLGDIKRSGEAPPK